MNLDDLNKVWEIKALKKAGEEEAKKMLEKIAKQVQPIMRKHKWRVKLLSEFCPKNPALLGLNVGAGIQVKLRLRRPKRDWDFFTFDQVLDTMLHELCHNVHGSHNANFYKLWDELRKECEELMAKGIIGTGEGFDLAGRRFGGFSCQPPLSSLHKTALAAAEKRVRMKSLLPSGPKRLGGDNAIMGALSPVQAAAMAAERRLQDDAWCGSHSGENLGDDEVNSDPTEDPMQKGKIVWNSRLGVNDILFSNLKSRKRSRESDPSWSVHLSSICSDSRFVDLTMDKPKDGFVEHQRRSQGVSFELESTSYSQCSSHSRSSFLDLSTSPGSISDDDRTPHSKEPVTWECLSCTLLNRPLAPICELCGTRRPKDIATKYTTWSCKFCTLDNSVKLEKCSACDQWRYSHGPPVSTRAPNLGT